MSAEHTCPSLIYIIIHTRREHTLPAELSFYQFAAKHYTGLVCRDYTIRILLTAQLGILSVTRQPGMCWGFLLLPGVCTPTTRSHCIPRGRELDKVDIYTNGLSGLLQMVNAEDNRLSREQCGLGRMSQAYLLLT